jgi:hypothetical protein
MKAEEIKTCGLKLGTPTANSYLNDLRVLDTETLVWSRMRIAGTPPEARYGHSLNISVSDILMFGGWTRASGNKANHIVTQGTSEYFKIWSTETMSWDSGQFLGKIPCPRYGHSATSIRPHLLFFGGWEFAKPVGNIIVLREYKPTGMPKQVDVNIGEDVGDGVDPGEGVGDEN